MHIEALVHGLVVSATRSRLCKHGLQGSRRGMRLHGTGCTCSRRPSLGGWLPPRPYRRRSRATSVTLAALLATAASMASQAKAPDPRITTSWPQACRGPACQASTHAERCQDRACHPAVPMSCSYSHTLLKRLCMLKCLCRCQHTHCDPACAGSAEIAEKRQSLLLAAADAEQARLAGEVPAANGAVASALAAGERERAGERAARVQAALGQRVLARQDAVRDHDELGAQARRAPRAHVAQRQHKPAPRAALLTRWRVLFVQPGRLTAALAKPSGCALGCATLSLWSAQPAVQSPDSMHAAPLQVGLYAAGGPY